MTQHFDIDILNVRYIELLFLNISNLERMQIRITIVMVIVVGMMFLIQNRQTYTFKIGMPR